MIPNGTKILKNFPFISNKKVEQNKNYHTDIKEELNFVNMKHYSAVVLLIRAIPNGMERETERKEDTKKWKSKTKKWKSKTKKTNKNLDSYIFSFISKWLGLYRYSEKERKTINGGKSIFYFMKVHERQLYES